MFEQGKQGLEKNREGYLFTYLQIIFNQFRRFANIQANNSKPEDFRKFTVEFEKKAELLECKILAALMTALFFEAYIYDYGARKKSANYITKYLDKLDPVSKWIIIPKLIVPPGLDESDEIFERLRKLFSLRNELAHHKTKESNEFMATRDFPDEFLPHLCIKLILDVMKKLKKLDNSEEFANLINDHIGSWITHISKNSDLYPLLWEA